MDNPFFSVIVPLHNAEQYMRKGLDIIREQTFKDYELILVCDRCTDRTVEIARGYTDIVLEVDNGRAGLSRNDGLDVARGKWILWADDDDWYVNEFAFGMLHEMLKGRDDIDILAYAFYWKGRGYVRNLPEQMWPAIWNKAWRREFIGDERFPDWKHSDDYGFAVKMHPKARVAFWDMPLYYYNFMRPGSVSDRIRDGEFDNKELPEEFQEQADKYQARLARDIRK